jgi:peptidyl-prolyl isomerase G (cyclophilin G)
VIPPFPLDEAQTLTVLARTTHPRPHPHLQSPFAFKSPVGDFPPAVSCLIDTSPLLTGKHVVFGRVIRGYGDVIPKIMDVPTDEKDRPRVPIVVSNCGELELRRKPVAPQLQQRKDHFFIPLLPPCGCMMPSVGLPHCRVSPELVTGQHETRWWRRLTTISFALPRLFLCLFLIPCIAEEVVPSRDVTGERNDSPKRSRSRHKHQKRRHGDNSNRDSRSRSRSLSRSRSPSGSPGRRGDPASDSGGYGHQRGGSSRKRHKKDKATSSRKPKHHHVDRSRSPVDVRDDGSRDPGVEGHKETEEEYDARLEREENERIAAKERKRLEALKDQYQQDLEKPPQNGVRFKGTQIAPLLPIRRS